ncbi:hypothetical protein ONZ45_g6514 [Pleurotus djamor]|nr:hypothetical protein ONZ45_g6514 [Pleurotus djamor]
MAPILSEILLVKYNPRKFSLSSPLYTQLREDAGKLGATEQYYGKCTDKANTLVWVLQWPTSENVAYPTSFKGTGSSPGLQEKLEAIQDGGIQSWIVPFDDEQRVRPALDAPLTQLCYLHIKEDAPTDILAPSLHKTFTDCYYAKGFTGGYWGPTLNDPKMYYYYLGWETRQLHDEYAKTDLFDEEIDKIMPHADGGGSNYAVMTRYQNRGHRGRGRGGLKYSQREAGSSDIVQRAHDPSDEEENGSDDEEIHIEVPVAMWVSILKLESPRFSACVIGFRPLRPKALLREEIGAAGFDQGTTRRIKVQRDSGFPERQAGA